MKSIFKVFIFFGFLLVFLSVYPQNQQRNKFIDSLISISMSMPEDSLKVQVYGTLFEQLQFSNIDLANTYTRKKLALSKTIGYKKGIAIAYFQLGDFNRVKGKIDSARFYYNKAQNLASEIKSLSVELFVNHSRASFEMSLGNYKEALYYAHRNIAIYTERDTTNSDLNKTFSLIGSEYELIGSIHQEMGNYKIALNESLKALRFFEEKKDTIRKGDALMQLGNIESLLKNNNSAIEHVKEAYAIYDHYNDNQYKAYAANNIGEFYLLQDSLLKANTYFEEALEIAKTNGYKAIQGNSLASLGRSFLKSENYTQGKNYLNQAINIHRELESLKNISGDLNELAKVELAMKNPQNALPLLNESVMIANDIGAKDNLSDAYLIRSKTHKTLRNHKKALNDYELHKEVNDSIFNITKSQQIEELRTIYETEKKEQQITLQEQEITVLEQKAEISTLQKILLGGLLILSLIGFYGIQQKMKRNKLEKEKVDAELAFKKKELTTHALHLAKKNEVLESLKQKAQGLKDNEESKTGYQQLIRTINFDLQDDNNWENFARYFEEVHKDFNSNVKLKYPQVTSNELRLLALLKMNLSSKEIANILNISAEGIKKARYRLRKKLDITTEDSLQDLVLSL